MTGGWFSETGLARLHEVIAVRAVHPREMEDHLDALEQRPGTVDVSELGVPDEHRLDAESSTDPAGEVPAEEAASAGDDDRHASPRGGRPAAASSRWIPGRVRSSVLTWSTLSCSVLAEV